MLSTWNKALLLLLASVSPAVWAQDPRSAEGSWQHADGLWLGLQRSDLDPFERTVYLVDNGQLELNRSVPEKRDATRLNWTLGVGERFDRFIQADGQTFWERAVGRHRFSLGLNAGGSIYYGSTRFANLEDQFLLTNGLAVNSTDGDTYNWGLGATLSDTISLTKTLDLTLDTNHQQSRSKVVDQNGTSSEINSWGAVVDQRWVIARLQASARKTELELDNDVTGINLRGRQSVLDVQARMLVPLVGRLNGSVGWQDLRSTGSNAPARRLSGPELGLAYTPLASWSASIFARSLKEEGNNESNGEFFGEAQLAFRSDAKNNFTFGLSKQIDLLTSYRIFSVQNVVATDEQRSTVTGQIQWAHQRGRYQLTSSIVQSRQEFAQSQAEFTELNITQTYDVTRRGQLSLLLGERHSRFDTNVPPVSLNQNFASARLGWQETLVGGLRPLGGRTFYRVDASYEHLHEEITTTQADRLTLLLSLGQLGNF